ncbi:MAG: AMP-binding protein [Pseudomonadota bacterium]
MSSSYVCGTGPEPLRYQTIGMALRESAERWPTGEALVVCEQNVRMSYSELDTAVTRLAAALLALGLTPGDRIGIWSVNCVEWVLTQLAAARAGLVLVTVNPAYRSSELRHALTKTNSRALVFGEGFREASYAQMLSELMPELEVSSPGDTVSTAACPALEHLVAIAPESPVAAARTFASLGHLVTPQVLAELESITVALQPDDPINVQFTSGTTGLPKGATLSHFNILNNGFFCAQGMRFTARDRLCIPVPLYHCFGMVMGVLGCLTHGATMVFPGASFQAETVLRAVESERCTGLYGVPTMFIAELDHPHFEGFDLSSLRTGIMAGAPCPIEVMRRVIERMHLREITIAYGMTETSPVSFQTAVDDPIEQRVGTVGRIHPHVQVKIVDAKGSTVPRGETGELCTRGYSVMLGYWDDEVRSQESIDRAGWMHTGDQATIDEDGYCRIVGRVKDMIIRGGENIYPREVEEYLYQHPKIQDVAVFGVPDDKYGEQVAAWIRLHDGEQCTEAELRDFCEKQIAYFKIPKYFQFVDEFPMTVTGKIQKFVMRQRLRAT